MRPYLREPLIHFLVLGALLFAWFEWRGGATGPGTTRIVVTPGLVEHLASGFARTWRRPPDAAELKGLVDEYVKEEIAVREASEMGLDRDDTVIRRRLRQKLEFLVEDAAERVPPTDAELQAWLDRHPEAVRAEPRVSLRQVFVRDGAGARERAADRLARIRGGADPATLGDPSTLPAALPLVPLTEVARTFGDAFAKELDAVEPGLWAGPLASTYGLHLVLVAERVRPAAPALADVRPLVEREVLVERRRAELDALYETLLEKYTVRIELPKDGTP